MSITPPDSRVLSADEATTYAGWFACLAEPVRVRLLHAVATSSTGATVGALTDALGVSQSTCSHHVRKLAEVGFVRVHKEGTTTVVTVNEACCTGLPHAADAVMGLLAPRDSAVCAEVTGLTVRAMREGDWDEVLGGYATAIATRTATFETAAPDRSTLDSRWLPGHRWVADLDGRVVGWATLTSISARECYAGVAETSVCVAEDHRGRGVGAILLRHLIDHAERSGIWTVQASCLTGDRAGLALHHAVGFRTVGVRERVARLDGVWHDTVLLERRSPTVPSS